MTSASASSGAAWKSSASRGGVDPAPAAAPPLRRAGRLAAAAAAAALTAAAAVLGGAGVLEKACPPEGSGLRSTAQGPAVKVAFHNRAGTQATLHWVQTDGVEQQVATLPDGDSTSMQSFAGHVWRLRAEASHTLLAEHVLKELPTQDVEAWPCGGAAAAGAAAGATAEDLEWLAQHGTRGSPALAGCPLAALLSEGPVRGLHVLCAVEGAVPGQVDRLCVFAEGQDLPACTHSLPLQGAEQLVVLAAAVVARLRLARQLGPKAPGPAFFTASGRQLPATATLADVGVPSYRRALVLMEGGAWHWPPVRVGFERPVHGLVRSALGGIVLRTLSLQPRIFEVKSFIEETECNRMLEKAGPYVRKSKVVVKDKDQGKPVESWRSSFNYFLPSEGDTVLEALDERVQNLTRIPITHAEYAQVLKYEYMGRYAAHTDYFDPKDYQHDKGTMMLTADGVHNRLLTVFMYMSDVEKGGETYFPAHGGMPHPTDYEDCTRGYSVKPERRKVIIFYNMHPSGELDRASLHGGCRVINGTKWSANFWVWNVPRDYKSTVPHRAMAAALQSWEERTDRAEEAAVLELAAALSRPPPRPARQPGPHEL